MSDGMAFLTGAAFAGVAVLFLMRGGAGANIGATVPPVAQLPPSLTSSFDHSFYEWHTTAGYAYGFTRLSIIQP
jgi:hypothetical protein